MGARIDVYRFVHVNDVGSPHLPEDFKSDAEREKPARGRARQLPELLDGLSTFRTLDLAKRRWADIADNVRGRDPGAKISIGEYIARVTLDPGRGFSMEDLGDEDGHQTTWGDPDALAAAVAEIVSAEG